MNVNVAQTATRPARGTRSVVAAVYQTAAGSLSVGKPRQREVQGSAGPPALKGYAMRDDPSVIALVARVGDGDQEAWDELIERYSPLVWSICARYQLSRPDIDDVGQSVWLLLVEQIGNLRQPAALPGWLATTTRRECLRVLRAARRHDHAGLPPEDQMPADSATMVEQEVIVAERDAALRAAFAELPPGCHDLLSMLVSDPPHAYAEVSETLGIAVGSIGPMRARCLDRLRRSPLLRVVLGNGTGNIESGSRRGEHRG
jgi:RNA polymerase sigma factor (sigma-70 family)